VQGGELPSGTLTFLFTDIEGSTRLLVELGRLRYGELLLEHEGAVWVANELGGTISRIDPHSRSVTSTIRVGHSPGAVAAGYGKVWVAVRAP
jgi:YVTN family beta-propeller protein